MSNSDSSPPASPIQTEKVPRQIGKYKLIRKLGAGGMGAVFLAQDQKTNRSVALKVLPREKAANDTLVKRFRSEAQSAANLEHENIVRVYEADEAEGYLYIALEYVDGTDVNCVLRKRERMPVKRSIEVVRQVAQALQHAHEQGIVHRDIKPSNLMIRKDGVIKLTDMGLARSIDESDDTNITRAGTTVGTVDYMAPEQARNSRLADIRSDLYSLGCTWFQMLTGHPPFHLGSLTNKLQAHASASPPDPRDDNPDVPESIVIMIQRLMAKKPEDRYQTPQELLDDLQNAHLHRQAPSDHLFSALATAGDEGSNTDLSSPDAGTSPHEAASTPSSLRGSSKSARANQKHRSGENPLIPPRDDSRAGRKPTAESNDGSKPTDFLKYLVIAGVVIGVFIGIWYIVTSFASGLSPGGIAVGESQRHAAEELLENTAAPTPTVSAPQQRPVNPARTTPEKTNPAEVRSATLTWPERPAPSAELSKTPLLNPELELTVPQWAQVVPMADEIEKLFADWKPHVVTVGRWQNKIGSHPSLNAAFEASDSGNLWIQLIGPGPFVLNPVQLKDRNLILSSDDTATEPIVVCLSNPENSTDHFLSMNNGSLLLASVNFVSAAHQFAAEKPASLISLTRGDLFVRDVSMTLYGQRSAPTTAVRLRGEPDDESARILIDRTLIRGAWTAFQTQQNRFTALLVNSLLLSDGVPSISLAEQPSASASSEAQLDPKSRWLRILQSTIASSGSIISVRTGDAAAEPTPVTTDVQYSILSAASEAPDAMLSLNGWPLVAGKTVNLHWLQHQSLIAGWKSLISSRDSAFVPVSDLRSWNSFWNTTLSESEFLADRLPVPQPIGSSSVDPEQWRWSENAPSANQLAGCPAGSIRISGREQQTIASALTQLDESRPVTFSQQPVETIELDLDRTNLQQRLNQQDWKSGTRFLLSGTKPNQMLPVVIDGRSLTLEMAPDQPDSFRIEPRGSQSKPLIAVSNGSLRLKNMRLKIPNRTRDPSPIWAVSVANGSLLIEDSLLEGPYLANKNHRGMIHWETGRDGRSLRPGLPYRHLCSLQSSYVTTLGTTVSLQPLQGIVNLRNTTLAAEGSAISLDLTSGRGSATLDFKKSTFTGSEAIVSIAGTPLEQPVPAANFIIRECVFAAPLPGAPKELQPTLLEASTSWIDRRQLLWWERANAYSRDLTCFLRPADGVSKPSTIDDWKLAWGMENVQKPLNTADGVLLKEDYPVRTSLPPEFFQLDEKSRALSWGADGSPVGATPAGYIFLLAKDNDKSEKKTPRPTSGF